MEQHGYFIPASAIAGFEPPVRAALARYLLGVFDIKVEAPDVRPGEEGLVQLSVGEAKTFLITCSKKTRQVLHAIVDEDGDVLVSDLYRTTRLDDLSGVWTGLTRRVRNVCGSDDAKLLGWSRAGEADWRCVMSRKTVESLRVALAAR
jgi:hypothetical protein